MKILAIDYGQRRIGLALSDEEARFALPLGTHTRKPNDIRNDIRVLLELVKVHQVRALVVGRPSGSTSSDALALEAERFIARLMRQTVQSGLNLPLHWVDERFSTAQALRGMEIAGITRRDARSSDGGGSVDARAAAIILEGFLALHNADPDPPPDSQPDSPPACPQDFF